MRAASGSTQMLYSARRRDVALTARRAAHNHGAGDVRRDLRSAGQRQRDVGQRTERDQGDAGMGADGFDNGIHRVYGFRIAAGRGIMVVAQAVLAVEPLGVHVFAQERMLRAGKTGTEEPQSSAVYRALRAACATGTLPATMVMARTSTSGARRAMIRATASSEAVSVSMRKARGTWIRYHRRCARAAAS